MYSLDDAAAGSSVNSALDASICACRSEFEMRRQDSISEPTRQSIIAYLPALLRLLSRPRTLPRCVTRCALRTPGDVLAELENSSCWPYCGTALRDKIG